ncbi:MAG: flagellar hook-basal body complex protein FliE [Vicinamibacterales bacterium]|jgi:flagellar hook-basal body complex protein FliE
MAITPIGSRPAALSSVSPAGTPATGAPGSSTGPAPSGGFADSLSGLLAAVDESAGAANTAIVDMVQGKGDAYEAMLSLQRAETTLQLTVQIRNKLVQAYQDVMRMPI